MRTVQPKISKGFTLAEILIVVSILVVLSLAVLMAINPFTQFLRGYDTVRRADLNKLRTAFENYYGDHNCYPSQSLLSQCGSSALAPYLDKIPCDPGTKAPYKLNLLPAAGACPQKYAIYASLANAVDTRGDDIAYCKDTIVVSSTDMKYLDIVNGCSGIQLCTTMYGCRNGACVVLFQDSVPTCGIAYCTSNCNGINCSLKNRRGSYTNECH